MCPAWHLTLHGPDALFVKYRQLLETGTGAGPSMGGGGTFGLLQTRLDDDGRYRVRSGCLLFTC